MCREEYVCPKDTKNFVSSVQEIKGFDLGNLPRGIYTAPLTLPSVIPLLYHSSRRAGNLKWDAVAIQLSALYNNETGQIKFKSKAEVAEHFGFEPKAKFIIVGVNHDADLETYWLLRKRNKIIEQIKDLNPDLITTPNFSMFLDSPRRDNLFNMKRIAICWSEFAAAGIPSALHLNARTDNDWQRWTDFILESDEINCIAFEYATGATYSNRGEWYTEKLIQIAEKANRKIQIVTRGGTKYFRQLCQSFDEVIFVDTNSFMKSVNRYTFRPHQGKSGFRWEKSPTPPMAPIDAILQHNVEMYSSMLTQSHIY